MKHKHIFKILFICLTVVFTSCSNDDDTIMMENTSSIVNKWWYHSDGVNADIYFNSNGNHQQRQEFFGNIFESSGEWIWLDEDNGLMKIDNLNGDVQVASEVWFRFSNIEENSFTIEQSLDGENYSQAFNYQDTEPEN